MKPVMISVAPDPDRVDDARDVCLRDVPAHRRTERSPLDRDDVARIDPFDLAGPHGRDARR